MGSQTYSATLLNTRGEISSGPEEHFGFNDIISLFTSAADVGYRNNVSLHGCTQEYVVEEELRCLVL